MTIVSIRKTGKGEYLGFTCKGHAGYARGKQPDILCAAISVLVTNTVNSLEVLAEEKFRCVADEESGYIRCDFDGALKEKSVFLLDSMVFGLQTLVRDYGKDYLQVHFEEV